MIASPLSISPGDPLFDLGASGRREAEFRPCLPFKRGLSLWPSIGPNLPGQLIEDLAAVRFLHLVLIDFVDQHHAAAQVDAQLRRPAHARRSGCRQTAWPAPSRSWCRSPACAASLANRLPRPNEPARTSTIMASFWPSAETVIQVGSGTTWAKQQRKM